MAQAATVKKQKSTLDRPETIWGYIFIAAPLIGFILFSAGPLLASVVLSFTNWNILSDSKPTLAPNHGLANWQQLFDVEFVEQDWYRDIYPNDPVIRGDAITGENIYRCGQKKRVLESQLDQYEGQPDRRPPHDPIHCEQIRTPAIGGKLFPVGHGEVLHIALPGDNHYYMGAKYDLVWRGLFNTFYMAIGIPISLALSLALAIIMNQKLHGAWMFRTIYYVPTILPITALALIWMWIFNPTYGLLNYFLGELGFGSTTQWLKDEQTVKPALITMGIWRGMGYQIVIFLAGLQGVPRHLYEAASIDGAGPWKKFTAVTWPALTPTTFFLLITSLIGVLQTFQEPYIMAKDNRAATTVVMQIQQTLFYNNDMGLAASMSWLLGAIIIVITVINFVLAKRWVFYES